MDGFRCPYLRMRGGSPYSRSWGQLTDSGKGLGSLEHAARQQAGTWGLGNTRARVRRRGLAEIATSVARGESEREDARFALFRHRSRCCTGDSPLCLLTPPAHARVTAFCALAI